MSINMMKQRSKNVANSSNCLLWISYVAEFWPTLKQKILAACLPCKEKSDLKGSWIRQEKYRPAAVLHYRPGEQNLEDLLQEKRTYSDAVHVAVLDEAQWTLESLSLLKEARFQLFTFSSSFRHARVIQFLHKHVKPTGKPWYRVGPLLINFRTQQILVWGRRKSITRVTCRLLIYLVEYFLKHPTAPYVPKETLFQEVWGYPSYNDYRTLHTHIHYLRRILEDDPQNPRVLKTVGNQGYFLDLKMLAMIDHKRRTVHADSLLNPQVFGLNPC